MDFTNFFRNLMELIETVAMLGGLVYITRALRLRDDRKAAKLMYIKGAVYMMIFIVLNVVNGYLF